MHSCCLSCSCPSCSPWEVGKVKLHHLTFTEGVTVTRTWATYSPLHSLYSTTFFRFERETLWNSYLDPEKKFNSESLFKDINHGPPRLRSWSNSHWTQLIEEPELDAQFFPKEILPELAVSVDAQLLRRASLIPFSKGIRICDLNITCLIYYS